MKRLPKYTPAEVRNDPYGFTYKEMSEVIGENEAKALYEELILSILVDTFISKISLTMQPGPKIDSISGA